jgi:hypothetical protein
VTYSFTNMDPLFQILKLLPLQLHHSLGNMMCTESSSEFWPVDALRFLMGFHISIPLVGCRPESWWEPTSTFSWLPHCTTCNFFSIDWSQSLAFNGSTAWEKVGGLVHWKSPSLSLSGGGDAWGWAACMLTMLCYMVWSIWACIASTCSRIGGGDNGGLTS